MNIEKTNQPAQPQFCKNCNKFYGAETREWLCSKCYEYLFY
jgi:hypothetical protein